MNDIVHALIGETVVHYRVYAAQLQALFLPGELRALDDFGVPLPLIEKLSIHLNQDNVDVSRRMLAMPDRAPAKRRVPISGVAGR